MRSGKLFTSLLLLSAATACAATGRLLEQLRSDHAALISAEQDFHNRRERGTLKGAEVVDYAAYVARLHRQVAEDCVALTDSGIPAPPDISCPTTPAVVLAPAPVDQAGERTSAEKTADLDAELFNGMGEFDEMLLREQERIKAASPHTAAGRAVMERVGNRGRPVLPETVMARWLQAMVAVPPTVQEPGRVHHSARPVPMRRQVPRMATMMMWWRVSCGRRPRKRPTRC